MSRAQAQLFRSWIEEPAAKPCGRIGPVCWATSRIFHTRLSAARPDGRASHLGVLQMLDGKTAMPGGKAALICSTFVPGGRETTSRGLHLPSVRTIAREEAS